MIKVGSKVEADFSYIFNCLNSPGSLKSSSYVGHKCGCPDYPSYYLQRVVPTQKPHPTTNLFLFLSDPPFSTQFPAIAGSCWSLSLQLDGTHLTFAMAPSLLHTILSDTLTAKEESPTNRPTLRPNFLPRVHSWPPPPRAKKANPMSPMSLPRCNIQLNVMHYQETKIWCPLWSMQLIHHCVHY
jgi:hypothetical protein